MKIDKILEVDYNSDRVPNLEIRHINLSSHRSAPLPEDNNPVKDLIVLREALLAAVLYIEQIGLMKKGTAMKMAIDGLNSGYIECCPEDNVQAATFDEKGNLIREFEIWMEGYIATGESGTAKMIGKGTGRTFDEAIMDYMTKNPNHGIEKNTRGRSNWAIWACCLFDNETDARKSFG
jgi:hypothetical protein